MMLSLLADGFEMFSVLHGVSVLGCLLFLVLWIGVGLLAVKAGKAELYQTIIGVTGVLYWLFYAVWYLVIEEFNIYYSLPFQFCDMAMLVAALGWLFKSRLLKGMLYFWALGFSAFAFVFPILIEGPDRMRFWLFWTLHIFIVGGAFHDMVVLRFRPYFKDWLWAFAVTFMIVVFMFILNHFTNGIYGFIGNNDDWLPDLILALGPWPLRILYMLILSTLLTLSLYLPWAVYDWVRGKKTFKAPADELASS